MRSATAAATLLVTTVLVGCGGSGNACAAEVKGGPGGGGGHGSSGGHSSSGRSGGSRGTGVSLTKVSAPRPPAHIAPQRIQQPGGYRSFVGYPGYYDADSYPIGYGRAYGCRAHESTPTPRPFRR